jgi:DNA invertase Pin-like site-specific DNA recombinase
MQPQITTDHFERNAYVYVRETSGLQGVETPESSACQHALRERAIRLGWKEERVVTIDADIGEPGSSSNRAGFQHLVAEVSRGRAGIVMALEETRLTRSHSAWQMLVEICASTGTLLLVGDDLFDPSGGEEKMRVSVAPVARSGSGDSLALWK